MKYMLIIKNNDKDYRINTETYRQEWTNMPEETLKQIIENWFYADEEEERK